MVSPRQRCVYGRVIVLMVVFVVIFAGCSSAETVTDGGGADTSSGVDSVVRPGQTGQSDESVTGGEGAVNTPDGSVMKADESGETTTTETSAATAETGPVATGAMVLAAKGFSDFSGQRVGLIANRASVVNGRSLIDVMADVDSVDLVSIFAPEHGLRADAGAGELVDDDVDPVTGLPVFSLYGATRSPSPESLANVDVLVYDLQDVGARFYTYTATMGLAMQAAAEAGIPFVVLDRPNPIGSRPAGSVRTADLSSFVSQYPVPSLHGMTSGELATAIKGEGWLTGLESLDLRVVPMTGWTADMVWADTGLDWFPPSPGLPTAEAALAYPATVLFEATTLSYGRGTDYPFQQIGAPWVDGPMLAAILNEAGLAGVRFDPVTFTPVASEVAADPQYEGQELPGVRVVVTDSGVVDQTAAAIHMLGAVLEQAAVRSSAAPDQPPIEVIDRPSFLDLLTGDVAVREALEAEMRPADIVASWAQDLVAFDEVRSRYRLY